MQQLSTTQYSVTHHSEPERRKNLHTCRGKVLTSDCQMWRGLPSSIAGKSANNHFDCLGVLTSHTCCNPKWSGLYVYRKPSTSSTNVICPKEQYCPHAPNAQFSHGVTSREMSIPTMTVSGIIFLLSLSPPSNNIKETRSFR
jgi:hypothetical protein